MTKPKYSETFQMQILFQITTELCSEVMFKALYIHVLIPLQYFKYAHSLTVIFKKQKSKIQNVGYAE